MKSLPDQFHKKFIASVLEQLEEGEKGVSWNTLAFAYQDDKKSKAYRKLQEEMLISTLTMLPLPLTD